MHNTFLNTFISYILFNILLFKHLLIASKQESISDIYIYIYMKNFFKKYNDLYAL